MAAAAPARTAPARRAPARRPPTKSKRRPRPAVTPPGGMARIPATAVGRTAGAVGGLADSGVVIGLSRTRMWIGLLAVLLGGIVALNVWGLGLSASANGIAAEIDALERNNGVVRARVARNESVERVQKTAAAAGLGVPEARAVRYRKVGDDDVAKAAARLESGQIGALAAAPEAAEIELQPTPTITPPPTPAAPDPTPAPAESVPTPSPAPAPAAPSSPEAASSGDGGGGLAP